MTGDWVDGAELDARYWFANLRGTVRFDDAVRALAGAAIGTFVEASPHPVLTASAESARTPATGRRAGTLRRDDGGPARFLASLGGAHVRRRRGRLGRGVPRRGRVTCPPTPSSGTATGCTPRPPTAAKAAPADARFWAAVDRDDPADLAGTLGVTVDTPLEEVLPALARWRRRRTVESTVDSWRYGITWKAAGLPAATLSGRWLVVRGEDGTGQDVVDALARTTDVEVLTLHAGRRPRHGGRTAGRAVRRRAVAARRRRTPAPGVPGEPGRAGR